MLQPLPYEAGEALCKRLIELRHQIDVLELEFARLSSEFDRSDYYEDEGFTTALNWIRVNCHMNSSLAGDRMAVGRCLERLPESTQAMCSGELGFAHLVVLSRTAEAVRQNFHESDLLDKAKKNSPGKLHHLCDHYRHANDPARFAQEQAEIAEQRKLKLSTWPNGVVSIDGFLDPVGGAAFRSALEPLARPNGADDTRHAEQRMADALVELVCAKQTVSLQVTASVETLLGLPGAPAGETDLGVPISAKTIERWACDCSVTRVLFEGESTVIDVGRAVRTVKGPRRRALNARDKGCRWPGCERPAGWSAGHHFVFWFKGGDSSLGNQVLLCHRHHWMVHEGGWQLVRSDGGKLLAVPPPTRFKPYVRGPD
ncbi:MAG TPA: DUF222 domain-containing protein [Candidatus Dormibacteraeota bacterium]|nr:DUF222 domain-containing protein [Candidatus Dormibacteraeota bacterium]